MIIQDEKYNKEYEKNCMFKTYTLKNLVFDQKNSSGEYLNIKDHLSYLNCLFSIGIKHELNVLPLNILTL